MHVKTCNECNCTASLYSSLQCLKEFETLLSDNFWSERSRTKPLFSVIKALSTATYLKWLCRNSKFSLPEIFIWQGILTYTLSLQQWMESWSRCTAVVIKVWRWSSNSVQLVSQKHLQIGRLCGERTQIEQTIFLFAKIHCPDFFFRQSIALYSYLAMQQAQ